MPTAAPAAPAADLHKLALNYVETTGKALGVALKLAEADDTTKTASAERIPRIVSLLKQAKLIDDHEVKEAEQQLASPAQALDVLADVLTFYSQRGEKAAHVLGSGESATQDTPVVKQANYVGARNGFNSQLSESDASLMKFLNP